MDLLFRTGQLRADAALEKIVAAFEAEFPNEARFVLLGSYASGNAHEASDLDLIILFRDALDDRRRAESTQLVARLAREIDIDADVALCSASDCPPVWAIALRSGRTIHGDESIKQREPTIGDYTTALIADVGSMMQALRPGQVIAAPLGPPNPSLPLLGYEAKPLRTPDGGWRPSTKALSMIAFWGASALVAQNAGKFTTSKDDVIETYRREIGDEWCDLMTDINAVCRREYAYAVPPDETGLAKVRAIAAHVLDFENYLLRALRF